MEEQASHDTEVKKLVEQTIRFMLFVVRWLARRYGLRHYINT